MGWFKTLIGALSNRNGNYKYAAMLSGRMPIYSTFGRDIYASDVVTQATRCVTDEIMKLAPTHVIKNGADVVLCQHTHCIGAYEKYNDCHILYGQGNFHFVWPGEGELWNNQFAVEYDTKSHEISFIPVRNGDHGISLTAGEDKNRIMSEFEYRNGTLQNGEWKKGWHDFCESKRENYTKVIREACLPDSTEICDHKFAHYLDCEAHTDVWRELFPTYNQSNDK